VASPPYLLVQVAPSFDNIPYRELALFLKREDAAWHLDDHERIPTKKYLYRAASIFDGEESTSILAQEIPKRGPQKESDVHLASSLLSIASSLPTLQYKKPMKYDITFPTALNKSSKYISRYWSKMVLHATYPYERSPHSYLIR
jgi:hypothetical protein